MKFLQNSLVSLAVSVLALFVCVGAVSAQDAKELRIIVLPFEVNAGPELEYLKDSLAEMLRDRLRSFDFDVVSGNDTNELIYSQELTFLDTAVSKDLAILSKSDYALFGSFTQVGENLSIDAGLVEAFGLEPPVPVFVEKEGIINVLPAIEDLAEKVRLELLKKRRIGEVGVRGLEFLDEDVVLMRLETKVGDVFDPKKIDNDIRRIYGLGYFDDIEVYSDEIPDGFAVTFQVEEKPRIQALEVLGTDEFDEDDITEVMNTKTGSVLNLRILSEDLAKIKELYRQDAYYNAEVDYEIVELGGNQAKLQLKIKEGEKLYIRDIKIIGAEALKEKDLKDELALAERGFFSWVTGSGVLKEELLNRDASALEAFYGNRGFIDAKVGQPEVDFQEDGIAITFRVEEGSRYKAGNVAFTGDLLTDNATLAGITQMDDLTAEDEFFDKSVLRSDAQALSEYYSDYGFAFAEADTDLNVDKENLTVDITYVMRKRQKVFIRRVEIEGATKTRDNVIRRQLRLADGDAFSGSALRRSNQRLNRLGYFEQANVETVSTPEPDQLDLKVRVKEKPTGQLSAGVGYSSFSQLFFSGQITENNLFGKGYALSFNGAFSARDSLYNLNFTNPSVYDGKFSAGLDLYRTNEDYEEYDKETTGGRIRIGRGIGEYTRFITGYRFDFNTIDDVDDDAAEEIRDDEGDRISSAIKTTLRRDSTNRAINPSEGSVNSISAEYAGGILQGDDQFIKFILDTRWFYPLWWDHIFSWHAAAGYVTNNFGSEDVPVFERFQLGGINTVRGYRGGFISPRDAVSGDRIGGNRMFYTNFEYIVPLYEDFGLLGVAFFDTGQVWSEGEEVNTDLLKSVGGGIRWLSPMGPLRIEYGYALDSLPEQGNRGKLEFTVGRPF